MPRHEIRIASVVLQDHELARGTHCGSHVRILWAPYDRDPGRPFVVEWDGISVRERTIEDATTRFARILSIDDRVS
jgi:hypothetical protein